MLKIEFHCHTRYSEDSLTKLQDLVTVCRRRGIDRLVITDHNTIQGALRAKDLAPDLVIVGEEIMTLRGELLAAFVREEVPAGLAPEEAIRILKAQNAFISVSHPFDRFRKGHWQSADLEAIVPLVDAIEVFNSRCLWPPHNTRAQEFASRHGLAGTVGSDAHTLAEVGRATLSLPAFEDSDSFRTALRDAEQNNRLSAPWIHFSSRYAVWFKRWRRRR